MLKIFSIFKNKKDILDKNNSFIVFSVYSDKIEAFLIKKENDVSVEFIGIESQEGVFSDGDVDMNKLKLNCSKLKVRISEKNIISKNIIFGISSEIMAPIFISKSIKRIEKEKKIKKEEIDEIIFSIKRESKKKNKIFFLDDVERYFIDGYDMKNPIGLHGENLRVDLMGIESKTDINKTLKPLADFLGFDFFGVFALDTTLLLAEKEFKKNKDAVFINILNNHLSIFLVKKGLVTAIDNLNLGYGSFEKKISDEFSIGIEEARSIKNKFLDGNLDVQIMEKLRNIAILESKNILNKVRASLMLLDSIDLLPKDLFISFSGKPPLQIEQAFKKGNNWFSDLPFPQDVEIIFLDTINMSGIINKSLSLSKTNKSMYTNILVDGILKNINNFK